MKTITCNGCREVSFYEMHYFTSLLFFMNDMSRFDFKSILKPILCGRQSKMQWTGNLIVVHMTRQGVEE